jgi:hypothetical protein
MMVALTGSILNLFEIFIQHHKTLFVGPAMLHDDGLV